MDVSAFLDTLQVDLKPLGDRVAVLPDAEETVSPGGIFIPDTVEPEKKKQMGTVVALGKGWTKEDKLGLQEAVANTLIPSEHLQLGDRVCFGQFAGDDLDLQTKDGRKVKIKFLHLDACLLTCNPK